MWRVVKRVEIHHPKQFELLVLLPPHFSIGQSNGSTVKTFLIMYRTESQRIESETAWIAVRLDVRLDFDFMKSNSGFHTTTT